MTYIWNAMFSISYLLDGGPMYVWDFNSVYTTTELNMLFERMGHCGNREIWFFTEVLSGLCWSFLIRYFCRSTCKLNARLDVYCVAVWISGWQDAKIYGCGWSVGWLFFWAKTLGRLMTVRGGKGVSVYSLRGNAGDIETCYARVT